MKANDGEVGGPKYFCIGMNKTGTTSVERAFRDLGFRVGNQVVAETLVRDYRDGDWEPIISYCRTAQAFQDVPFSWPNTFLHLDNAFPGSKFILTVRDTPDQWYNSFMRYGALPNADAIKKASYRWAGWAWEVLSMFCDAPEDLYNKDHWIKHYKAHNDHVMSYFSNRSADLLTLNLTEPDAYKRFCSFLNVDTGGRHLFPWENRTSERACLLAIECGDASGAVEAVTAAGCHLASAEEGLATMIEALVFCEPDRTASIVKALDEPTASLSDLALEAAQDRLRTGDTLRALQTVAALKTLSLVSDAEAELDTKLAIRRGYEAAVGVGKLIARPQPALYWLPKLKRGMIADFGIETAARIYSAASGTARTRTLEKVSLASMLDWARSHGSDYREILPSREVQFKSADVLDEVRAPPASLLCRTTFTATLRNAVVSAKSNYILFPGTAVSDFQNDELAVCPLDYDVDPVLFVQSPASLSPEAAGLHALMPVRVQDCRRVTRALSLLGIHSSNFGHWIIEFLPKVWALMECPKFDETTILVDRQMPEQHLEALRLFVGPAQRVLTVEPGEQVAVDELVVSGLPGYVPPGPKPAVEPPPQVLDVEAFVQLRTRAISRLDDPVGVRHPERLFLLRKPGQHRKLVNQDEVRSILEGHGFVSVDFGDLPFRQQLEMMRSARMIIGPEGSSLLLSLLAKPGTRVGLLTKSTVDDRSFAQFCDHAGLTYIRLAGETTELHAKYPSFSNYRIAPERLNGLVDALG